MKEKTKDILTKSPNIIFIYGEEEFLIEKKFNELIWDFVNKYNATSDFDIFDSEKVELMTVIDSCYSLPFLSEKRIVGVKNFEKYFTSSRKKKVDEQHPFVKYLRKPNPHTIFLISSYLEGYSGTLKDLLSAKTKEKALKKIKSANFPYNVLFENAELIEIPKFYEKQIPNWIKSQLKGKEIKPEALELLLLHTNPNLRDINNELEKLLLFTDSKKEITEEDVAAVVGISKEYNIFQLQKAIGNRDLHNSLLILNNMLTFDRQEILILTMLSRYFSILWQLKEYNHLELNKTSISTKLGINVYFLDEYLNASKKFEEDKLIDIFNHLYITDRLLKTSSTNSSILMQQLIIKILNCD